MLSPPEPTPPPVPVVPPVPVLPPEPPPVQLVVRILQVLLQVRLPVGMAPAVLLEHVAVPNSGVAFGSHSSPEAVSILPLPQGWPASVEGAGLLLSELQAAAMRPATKTTPKERFQKIVLMFDPPGRVPSK
jgi:hypothetical protein